MGIITENPREVGYTGGSREDTCLSHITREVLWETPSILRTRNDVHCFADYVASPARAGDDLHRPGGIKTAGLKGYGLHETLAEFTQ
jgi:hypothetical protein